MNPRTLGAIAAVAMAAVGGTVWGITPAGGFGRTAASPPPDASSPSSSDAPEATAAPLGQFVSGTRVQLEGRVGHPRLTDRGQETFVLLEITGRDRPAAADAASARSAAELAIVIDKSGSMRGSRIESALVAAEGAVQRLRDGDHVSVVAFDTAPELVVARTAVSPDSRARILESIRGIRLGGDTCISCGIEAGLSELGGAVRTGTIGTSPHIMLLSDGKPTAGVRDVEGFRDLGARALASDVSISTIGLDLDFNEEIMTAIAVASNGGHYFVERDAELAAVFEREAEQLSTSVAAGVTANIELSSGVELVELVDRPFTRLGSRLVVPLGSLAAGETRTVLAKVRVAAGEPGIRPLASTYVAYRDRATNHDAVSAGTLTVDLVTDPTSAASLDGVVAERVQRAETAAALRDANALFGQGKAAEAQRRLRDARRSLEVTKKPALANAPKDRERSIGENLDSQTTELREAEEGFAAPTPKTPPAEAQRKQETAKKKNAARVRDAMF